ncbi:hypothetical protein FQZ97_870780 [compost metagenome]
MRPGHIVRQPKHTEPRQARGQVGIAVVYRQHVAALHVDAFAAPAHRVRQGLARARPQESDDAVMRVFQLAGMRRRTGARQIGGRRIHAQLQVGHAPRHQRLVRQFAAPHDAVHVLADQIHDAVADAHVELDVGIAGVERRQRRHEDQAGQRAGHVHPQPPPWQGRRAGQAGLGVVQVGQQAQHALVVGGPIRRDVDLARGAVQQLDPQPRLQLLDQLRHAGLAQVERLGRLREAAGFHHAGERLHRIETIHPCSLSG